MTETEGEIETLKEQRRNYEGLYLFLCCAYSGDWNFLQHVPLSH
jgi:hypothetical protein